MSATGLSSKLSSAWFASPGPVPTSARLPSYRGDEAGDSEEGQYGSQRTRRRASHSLIEASPAGIEASPAGIKARVKTHQRASDKGPSQTFRPRETLPSPTSGHQRGLPFARSLALSARHAKPDLRPPLAYSIPARDFGAGVRRSLPSSPRLGRPARARSRRCRRRARAPEPGAVGLCAAVRGRGAGRGRGADALGACRGLRAGIGVRRMRETGA